ncbi:MAG TPA: hypothetical protein PK536_04545 [Ignavibacteria bacterium]|nr:hypothetical protein [Bacteroidota bacterium]HRI84698.1 hypothetical protein [Ignavibacteria bacterium]HRJ99401.1 hypothetical protein [Ignavibacteria bacterium]
MLKSSLLEIIRSFSKQDLLKFEDFVRSPYFNKKENVSRLFMEIKNYAPSFTDGNLEKEKTWAKLFPGTEYNYGIMKNLIHDLTKLSDSFIAIEYSNADKLKSNIDLLAALLQRQISKVFSAKYDMTEKIYIDPALKNESYKMEQYYDFLFKLKLLKAIYNRLHNPGSSSFEYITESGNYFLYSAVINFYKYYNNYLAFNDRHIQVKDSTAETFLNGLNKNFIPDLIKKVKTNSEREYKILKCFYEMNIALNPDADISCYNNFKKSLQDCSDIIPRGDLKDLLVCLNNSLTKIREGKSNTGINSNREILEISNMEIENNLFLQPNGVMDQNSYINYILTAFTLREYESIEIFVKKFGSKIPEDRRENVNNYSQAHISFGKKEFDKSLEYLSKINHDFFNMKHLVRDIQMMNYYELNDYVSFDFALDSYKHFIAKNKSVTPHNRSLSEDFCNNIKKLFRLRESFDKFELEKVRKEIINNKLINKYWILDKLSEIENNNS